MRIQFIFAWLLVLCAPLRAAEAPVHPIGEIKAALGSVQGPTRHVAQKLSAYKTSGGPVELDGAAARYARANANADRAIAAYVMAADDYKTRQERVAQSVKVLEEDYFFISHGRQKTMEAIARDQVKKVAARHARQLRMRTAVLMEKARQEADKLRAEIQAKKQVSSPDDEWYGTQD